MLPAHQSQQLRASLLMRQQFYLIRPLLVVIDASEIYLKDLFRSAHLLPPALRCI